MKPTHQTALALALLSASSLSGVAGPEAIIPTSAPSGSILDSIHLMGNARLRYEYADMENLDEAYLASLRVRYGIKTDEIAGFKFLAEGENTFILTDQDRYSPFPPPNLHGRRSVIADPDNFELNRLQLSYNIKAIDTVITVGRQYIEFADQRFIGSIKWRQNDQTFDAVVVENKSIENLTFTYAYVDQVNRIFGEDTPVQTQDYFEGNSHLIHVEYTGIEDNTIRAFAYLFDFDNAALASSNTYGLELQGKRDSLNYLFTAALQRDAGDNPINYEEYYLRGELSQKTSCCTVGAGVELMTSDGTGRFQFPVGTNHKFNGFADAYLGTPVNGLIDYYAFAATKAFGMNHKVALHNFQEEEGHSTIGWEVDYVGAYKINDNTKFVLKAAYLNGKDSNRDITRTSAEINYSF